MRFGPVNPQVFEADVLFKRILTPEELNSILFMHKYAKEFEIDYEKMASGFESQMKKGELEPMALFYQLIDRIPEIRCFNECFRRASGMEKSNAVSTRSIASLHDLEDNRGIFESSKHQCRR